jgi:hypothetical protein
MYLVRSVYIAIFVHQKASDRSEIYSFLPGKSDIADIVNHFFFPTMVLFHDRDCERRFANRLFWIIIRYIRK